MGKSSLPIKEQFNEDLNELSQNLKNMNFMSKFTEQNETHDSSLNNTIKEEHEQEQQQEQDQEYLSDEQQVNSDDEQTIKIVCF